MCRFDQQTYRARPSTPAAARRSTVEHLHLVLGADPVVEPVADNVALVVSELATNAVTAGATTVTVVLTIHRDHVRVAVSDDAAGLPVLQSPAPHQTGGRGLRIVSQLARQWGTARSADGKQVWAVLSIDPVLTARVECSTH